MMGPRQVAQGSLFYGFSIEDHVPQDHLVRRLDRYLDLSEIRGFLAPYYSAIGRPSIDPELMIRMLLIGYCFGVRSERRLCEEVHVNLAFRWFCRLDLTDTVPDHSSFSKNRHGRFRDSDLFRHLFESVLARCIAEGLVGGEAFGVDASIVQANAKRLNKVDAADWAPERVTRAVEEYFETLDDEAFGEATPVKPKVLSPVDPAARFTGAKKTYSIFAYSTSYLVDLDNAVIVDVETTAPIRQAEVSAALDMLDRTQARTGLYPERFVGDGAYGNAETLGWLVNEKGIEPHVPVIDKSGREDGSFARADFTFEACKDRYLCPAGKELLPARRPFQTIRPKPKDDETIRYRAAKSDCAGCAFKPRCCPNTPARQITRSIHEGARDLAREIAKTDAFVASRRARRKVEMLFAHMKKILGLDRLRLRGPNGAKDEFILAATAQNLRKMAKLLPATA
ncbi:MAG: IS1182 family transposase [Pseudomonadota bacterium]